jgi:hypothetical protein
MMAGMALLMMSMTSSASPDGGALQKKGAMILLTIGSSMSMSISGEVERKNADVEMRKGPEIAAPPSAAPPRDVLLVDPQLPPTLDPPRVDALAAPPATVIGPWTPTEMRSTMPTAGASRVAHHREGVGAPHRPMSGGMLGV